MIYTVRQMLYCTHYIRPLMRRTMRVQCFYIHHPQHTLHSNILVGILACFSCLSCGLKYKHRPARPVSIPSLGTYLFSLRRQSVLFLFPFPLLLFLLIFSSYSSYSSPACSASFSSSLAPRMSSARMPLRSHMPRKMPPSRRHSASGVSSSAMRPWSMTQIRS